MSSLHRSSIVDHQSLPDLITHEDQLEELLSRPTPAVVELFKRLDGPLAILGAAGKIGPSLCAMAARARQAAGGNQDIFAVSRFSNSASRHEIERHGVRTVPCDLMDDAAVEQLPDAAYVLYLVGLKFGTSGNPAPTWATNTLPPYFVARRYRHARAIVSYSTACVYDLVAPDTGGCREDHPLEPLGEYSNAAVARERLFEYAAQKFGCRIVQNRLAYAVEMRYGVLVDLAQRIVADQPIDLSMSHANVIWQGDNNAATLLLLEHADNPPAAVNVSGPIREVRDLAEKIAAHMDRTARFTGQPAGRALLANIDKMKRLLGDPPTPIDTVCRWVAHWIASGGATLGKPTHFQTSDGRY